MLLCATEAETENCSVTLMTSPCEIGSRPDPVRPEEFSPKFLAVRQNAEEPSQLRDSERFGVRRNEREAPEMGNRKPKSTELPAINEGKKRSDEIRLRDIVSKDLRLI
jgi:hypothetical protein